MSTEVSFGGRIAGFVDVWRNLTSDLVMLELIKGVTFELDSLPSQQFYLPEYRFDYDTKKCMDDEVLLFIDRGIIEETSHEAGEIISNLFCRKKKSGAIRLIGNFKDINAVITYRKFKQTTTVDILDMVRPGQFMCSVDLKDAYYCINVKEDCRKFLKFIWNGKLYQFTCLAQGIGCAPRIFTKIMKIPICQLREKGINLAAYIDDIIIFADSYDSCLADTFCTIKLLESLGYMVNYSKSVITPTQRIEHLGLIIDTVSMKVKVNSDKCSNIISLCSSLRKMSNPTIRQVARVVGTMVSYIPGVEFGIMHYRNLEICKILALKREFGNFDKCLTLSHKALNDLSWWEENINTQCTDLNKPQPSVFIFTDSSSSMWGAVIGEVKTGGSWNDLEKLEHINVLEMKAILFGLKSLCAVFHDTHIRVRTDSSTCVAYINEKGGVKSYKCNLLSIEIWEWCISKNIYLSAEHVRGVNNSEADYISRNQNNSGEWSLCQTTFMRIVKWFDIIPTIDLFATRINCKVRRFVSWHPDPQAICFDTFCQYFEDEIFYAFPPFNCVGKFLKKVELERLEGIIIVPCWSSQPFFPSVLKLLIDVPLLLRWKPSLVIHPHIAIHPLGKKLRLMACHISGVHLKRRGFLQKLWTLCVKDGQCQLNDNTRCTIKNGRLFVGRGFSIQLNQV